MFKPVRYLQVAALVAVLGGCATTRTAAISPPAPPARPVAVGASFAQSMPTADKFALPPISAGHSTNSAEGFLDASGALKPDLQAYAREVADTRNVPIAHVLGILKSAQYNPTVAKLMTPGKTRIRRSWFTYRNRFVEPIRIDAGVAFWNEHRAMLDKTAEQYGVPQSIIVAIIGIETLYGRQTGNFRVLDALATLGFRNPDDSRPERSQLFRDQLADLIQLDHEQKVNALQLQGSFAGAIGLPQFMPGSLMRYAVDGDRDGHIDLSDSAADAIASVASFLAQHGWERGLPVFAPVILPANPSPLVAGGLTPSYDWLDLQAKGARTRPGASNLDWQAKPVGIIDLPDEPRQTEEYRTGTPNFFAITHYNRSYFYAASVADLAQAIANRVGYGGPDR